jgi:hypothetical protein
MASVKQFEGKFKQHQLLIVVRPLDRAVVDFTAPRGACEMIITVVAILDPSKDLRGSILEHELELELIQTKIQYQ